MIDLLKSVEVNTLVAIGSSLLVALIAAGSSLLGVMIANKSNISRIKIELDDARKRSVFETKREKLEELHILLTNWANMFFSNYANLILVMKGDIEYNKYLDLITENAKKRDIKFDRIEMIIHIYARELAPSYKKTLLARDKINDIAFSFKIAYENGRSDNQEYINNYTSAHDILYKKIDDLKSSLAELAATT